MRAMASKFSAPQSPPEVSTKQFWASVQFKKVSPGPAITPVGGADAADFACTISGSTVNVAFASSPDYDNPADADTNNVYVVTVLIDDGTADDANGATTLTITVADLNDEAPVFTSSSSVTTNEGSTTVVSLTATDADAADCQHPASISMMSCSKLSPTHTSSSA